jgi:hypothetical protein
MMRGQGLGSLPPRQIKKRTFSGSVLRHQIMKNRFAVCLIAAVAVLSAASASFGQVRRYQPSRPTISPYLQLFRDRDRNPYLPNYHAFVRPMQRQYETNQFQQQQLLQQRQAIGQLQSQVQQFQQGQFTGPLVAPTGKGAGFMRPSSRNAFMNTSRYYSQQGGAAGRR